MTGMFFDPNNEPVFDRFNVDYGLTRNNQWDGDGETDAWLIVPTATVKFYPKATVVTVTWLNVFGELRINKK